MLLTTMALAGVVLATDQAGQTVVPAGTRVNAFIDCSTFECHDEYLREEVDLVEYVRDRSDADVHVLITSAETGAGGREYTLGFIGQGRFAAVGRTLKATFDASDSEDRVRSDLATALTVGLLSYVASDSVPAGLAVEANLTAGTTTPAAPADDPGAAGFSALMATAHSSPKNRRANLNGGCRLAPTGSRPSGN